MKKYKNVIFWTLAVLAVNIIVEFLNRLPVIKTGRDKARAVTQTYPWRFGKVRYAARGKGEPLLLIHAAAPGRSARDWQSQIPELMKHYRVYAVDLLGFGASETPALSYNAYLYAALIRDFIKNIIRRETYVLAAGRSAAFAVKAYALSPESFGKLILVNPKNGPRGSAGINRVLRGITEWPVCERLTRFILGRGLPGVQIRETLAEIKIPLLILRGKGLNIQECINFLRED